MLTFQDQTAACMKFDDPFRMMGPDPFPDLLQDLEWFHGL